MLTSEDIEWDAMMTAYDARRLVEQGYDRRKSKDRGSARPTRRRCGAGSS